MRHCWLVPPLQAHCTTRTPSPVALGPPKTSRHLPLLTLTTFTKPPPTSVSCHRWLVWPFDVHCTTLAPSVVDALNTSATLPLCRATRLYVTGGGTVDCGTSRNRPAPCAGRDRASVPLTVPRLAPLHRSVTAADPMPRLARLAETVAVLPDRLNRARYRLALPGTSAAHTWSVPPTS